MLVNYLSKVTMVIANMPGPVQHNHTHIQKHPDVGNVSVQESLQNQGINLEGMLKWTDK